MDNKDLIRQREEEDEISRFDSWHVFSYKAHVMWIFHWKVMIIIIKIFCFTLYTMWIVEFLSNVVIPLYKWMFVSKEDFWDFASVWVNALILLVLAGIYVFFVNPLIRKFENHVRNEIKSHIMMKEKIRKTVEEILDSHQKTESAS